MANFIVAFNGTLNDLPEGWKICNGSNGTPDLQDRFIRGAVLENDIGNTGGQNTHIHSLSQESVTHTHGTSGAMSHTHTGWSSYYRGAMRNTTRNRNFLNTSHAHSLDSQVMTHNHTVGEGSNIPLYYALLYVMTNKNELNFPLGSIVMWTGNLSEIPKGWALCDGTNGTPDLRGKFIKGTVIESKIGITGGSDTHIHTMTNGAHSHTLNTENYNHSHSTSSHNPGSPGAMAGSSDSTNTTDLAGTSHTHSSQLEGGHQHTINEQNILPPYYSLAHLKRIF